MSELREKIADALAGAVSQDDRYLEHADAVLRVLAEHGGVKNLREQISLMVWRSANERAERAEADLAAARQQLDQVRRAYHAWNKEGLGTVPGLRATNWPDAWRDIGYELNAPARPAGRDEGGQ
jgi:hypothetical protein